MAKAVQYIDTWPYLETNLGTFGHTPVSGQLFTYRMALDFQVVKSYASSTYADEIDSIEC